MQRDSMKLDATKAQWLLAVRRRMLASLAGLLLLAMALLGLFLQRSLLKDGIHKTTEIADTMEASIKGLMVARDPKIIQETFQGLVRTDGSILHAFVVNDANTIVYSSDPADIGLKMDKQSEVSCAGCHIRPDEAAPQHTIVTRYQGQRIHRKVNPLRNEEACQACHDPSKAVTGVLIVDRGLRKTYGLIARIEGIIALSGITMIVLLGLMWTRAVNWYTREIISREEELRATLHSTADGILAVDEHGKVVFANSRFEQMWRISPGLLDQGLDDKLLDHVSSQLTNPDQFLGRVRDLYGSTQEDLDVLWFRDGRVFERYSMPLVATGELAGRVWSFRDITDQKRAEEQVLANEERQRRMLDHLPVGIVLSSGFDQKMLYQNPRFVEFFGYTIQDFPDVAAWWPLAYPNPEYRALIADEWNARLANAIRTQSEIEPMEAHITARDGTVKYMQIHAVVFGDLNFVTFIDLTDRKQAEETLRLNESRLEALVRLNQMTKGSMQELTDFTLEEAVRLTKSEIGYLAFMNEDESVLTMHSWSHTAMKQCAIQDKPIIYPVKDTGLWGEAVRQRVPVFTNDYAADNPLKKGYPEGHVRVTRHMNVPVFDEGRIVAVAGVGNKDDPYDDSDARQLTLLMEGMWRIILRRRADEEIRRMRIYLQNVFDSMPSVLIGVDTQGAVTHWNREATRLTGLSETDSKGRYFSEVLPQLQDQLDKVREAIREGRALENERFSVRNAEEDLEYYDLMVFPLVANGAQGAVLRLDDVTGRVQIEEMMVQTEKMMSVGGLAAGMAHEINNPLGGILQACQNIERRTSLELPKNAEVAQAMGIDLALVRRYLDERGILEFVAGIRSDGARAAEIVSDMLAFSRRSESRLAPIDLSEIVDTVLRLAANDYDLKKQYDFRNVQIVRDWQPGLPLVQCDKTKIEQVLLNLVKNAAQALAGHDKHRPPSITVRLRKEPHYLRIEVVDNGPGMDERVRRRVFEPFFTTKEVGVGTGLGLSVSYFIITKQHKGTLSVESTPGEGSRFIIRLPLRAEG